MDPTWIGLTVALSLITIVFLIWAIPKMLAYRRALTLNHYDTGGYASKQLSLS